MSEEKNKQLTAAEKEAAEKTEKERIAAEKAEKEAAEKAEKLKNDDTTYVMKVTHLSWGEKKMNHFYADKKPKISRKVMGKFHTEIDIWLKNKWVEKGKY